MAPRSWLCHRETRDILTPRTLLSVLVLTGGLLAAGARAQSIEPVRGEPAAPRLQDAARRFEVGLVYGLATFTAHHADAVWYDGAPVGADMDLQTTPSVGVEASWEASGNLRLGLRAARRATRLVLGAGADRVRSDLTLTHLDLVVERAFGGGRLRPVLGAAGGAVRAAPDGGAGATWHWSATPAVGVRFTPSARVVLRLLARAPLIWANGSLVAQGDLAAGAALLF